MGEKTNYAGEERNYVRTHEEKKGFYSEYSCAYSSI